MAQIVNALVNRLYFLEPFLHLLLYMFGIIIVDLIHNSALMIISLTLLFPLLDLPVYFIYMLVTGRKDISLFVRVGINVAVYYGMMSVSRAVEPYLHLSHWELYIAYSLVISVVPMYVILTELPDAK